MKVIFLMNKLIIIGLLIVSSQSMLLAKEPYCDPCWMVEVLKNKIRKAKSADEMFKLEELIETKYGQACEWQQQRELDKLIDKVVVCFGIACVAFAGYLVVKGTKALYKKLAGSHLQENIEEEIVGASENILT
jgi:uncharacterized membrane protein (DUF106 family)